MIDERAIGERFRAVAGELNERQRRVWAGAEALSHGRGGIAAVARASGLSERTVSRGKREAEAGETLEPGRVRAPGAGRKALTETDPALLAALEGLVADEARGDPESPLRWTAKSVRHLARALREQGHEIHFTSVPKYLRALDYSLQANRKTIEGKQHPDRDAQFRHINEKVKAALEEGEPVISVDTKKKELVGNYKNGGQEWRLTGAPELVSGHDFPDKELGKAIPYGVFDVAANQGWVSVGITADTAAFAVASIASWWQQLGRQRYRAATTLTITADCGGSNGNRTRLWKTELQRLADETGLQIAVCHFPPGTSKWNKIEHKLFSFISRNWRGRPLLSRQTIVSLIGATTSQAGLKVYARLDETDYQRGVKVSDDDLAAVNLTRDDFHPEWNYLITPTPN
ncbi:MAG: ISAzo13 family transposase [Actinobacteria bacterium]|nr:ISAzo13 family transposase [Actinomycetota bacterium]MCA1699014.1 ISAzo13 family transposase [Actinomycetota bacterium]